MKSRHKLFVLARRVRLIAVAVALGCVSNVELRQADAGPIFDYNGGAASHRADGPYTVGTRFTTGINGLLVTHLGAQDSGPNGPFVLPEGGTGFFTSPINVGIWNAAGTTLLASIGVLSSDPINDSYRYHPLGSPLILAPNTQYLIGAAVGGGIEWFEDNSVGAPPFSGLEVTMNQNGFAVGGVLSAPINDGGPALGRWAPANALGTALPEPTTLFIWAALGVVMIGCYVRTRRR